MLETPEISRALGVIEKAKSAAAAVEFLGDSMAGRQRGLDELIFKKLQVGEEVSAELCRQIFMQKWAIWNLQHQLLGTMASGQAASRMIEPMMNSNDTQGDRNG